MSRSRMCLRPARRMMWALSLGAALAVGLTPASASNERSSPEDRQRLVSIARALEQAPFKPGAKADRKWALDWIVNAPDVSVTVCPDALSGVVASDYRFAAEIMFQDMFAMAAHAIEHPDAASDANAQQLAGVESALNAYRSILRDKPEAKSPLLERLLQIQSAGGLPDHIRDALVRCSAKQ